MKKIINRLKRKYSYYSGNQKYDRKISTINLVLLLLLIFSGNVYSQTPYGQLWISHQDNRLGYIGKNCQRIYIHFSSVVQSKNANSDYNVIGKSMVNGNICGFTGTIKVLSITEQNKEKREKRLKEAQKHKDLDIINRTKYPQYVINATYCFNEDKAHKGAGIFKGSLKTYCYKKNNKFYYDDLSLLYTDNFRNNQFEGTWQSYQGTIKPCCWGDYRIPKCGDLDIGTGEFCPNSKYTKDTNLGWSKFDKTMHKEKKAIREWWM